MLRLSALLCLLALPALAEPPKVVVDIAPIHALVAQVMEGVATPDLLLDQDANPHAVQLKPSQARMLAGADLVIWVGPDLSPWLERTIAGLSAASSLVLMDNPATQLRDFTPPVGAPEPAHDAEGDAHGDDHSDDHGDNHDHEGKDPHLWLSVDNARAWLGVFADELAARDPDNAATYRANAARAQTGIDDLTARIEARLAPYAGTEIITFHASFGYFADRFPITIAGSVRPGDAASPSAAALAKLEALVATHDIACAYAEPAFDPALLEAIAGDTGLRIGTLDPTGVLQTPGPGHYAATLDAVAEGIVACLEDK
jgi:zinc transport system substrate-binding protein